MGFGKFFKFLFLVGIMAAPHGALALDNTSYPVDYNRDCALNYEDVQIFLNAFHAQDALADLAEPYQEHSIDDVYAFLSYFSQGQNNPDIICRHDVPNDNGLRPCPGFETEKIYPVSNYNGAMICPTPGETRVIYVSTDGHDGNDGLTPETAWRTPDKATELARSDSADEIGTEDWVVLKRGDVWYDERVARIRLDRDEAGQSADQPLVITSYGEGVDRPQIFLRSGFTIGITIWGDNLKDNDPNYEPEYGGYITISGLHIKSLPGMGGSAFDIKNMVHDIVLEDNIFEGTSTNALQQKKTDRPMYNVLFQNNIVVGNTSGPGSGGHAQGLFSYGVKDLIIRNNLFDHNGWAGNRDHGLPPHLIVGCFETIITNSGAEKEVLAAPLRYDPVSGYIAQCQDWQTPSYAGTENATIFNHSMYLQYDGWPAVIEHNIITRSSSHGVQARAGANIERNIFARNPLNAFVSGRNFVPEHQSTIIDNVVMEAVDIDHDTPRGFGLGHNNASSSIFTGNVVANMHPDTSHQNNFSFDITCMDGAGGGSGTDNRSRFTDECTTRMSGNITHNWSDVGGRANALRLNLEPGYFNDIQISSNVFSKRSGTNVGSMIEFFDKDGRADQARAGNSVSIFNNIYKHPEIFLNGNSGGSFDVGGDMGVVDFTFWQQNIEPNSTGVSSPEFNDPCRTLATYYDDVILGNTGNDNCAIMHDDDLFDAMMHELRAGKNRLVPAGDLAHLKILNYLRAGFDQAPLD